MELVIEVAGPCAAPARRTFRPNEADPSFQPSVLRWGTFVVREPALPIRGRGRRRGRVRIAIHRR